VVSDKYSTAKNSIQAFHTTLLGKLREHLK